MDRAVKQKHRCTGTIFRRTRWSVAGLVFLIALAAAGVRLRGSLLETASFARLTDGLEETVAFRGMAVSPEALKALRKACDRQKTDWLSPFTAAMLDGAFVLRPDAFGAETDTEGILAHELARADGYAGRKPEAFETLRQSYAAVFSDLVCFPVPLSVSRPEATVSFENSWMYERSFGGIRGHEGTDLMPATRESGVYPVLSMTAGVVEQVGWRTLGGWRIGIRSPHGGYFYYAHLSSYAQKFQTGDAIRAGQLLGYMGDSGYGEEGTTGMFDTHLHLGIYICTAHTKELSVNPYWILRYLEDSRIRYNF